MISRFKRPMQESTFVRELTSSSVQENEILLIPKMFFEDYQGSAHLAESVREELQFSYGETLHFLTTDTLYRRGMCYVLNDEDGRDMTNEYYGERFIEDGGQEMDEDQESWVIPESQVVDSTILDIRKGKGISSYHLKKQVFSDVISMSKALDSGEDELTASSPLEDLVDRAWELDESGE